MDYLEGFLIGPVWSDTDYRSRRHLNAHILLASLMAFAFAMLTLFPERFDSLILIKWPLALFLLILLFLLSPALSILYRRLPFYIRPFLLPVFAAKYLLLFYLLVHGFFPRITFEKESVLELLYLRVDDHIGLALEKIAASGGILVTVAGVVAGGLWVIAEGILLIAALILVPLLSIAALKCLQYGYDWGVKNLLDRQLDGLDIHLAEGQVWGNLAGMEERGVTGTSAPLPPLIIPGEERTGGLTQAFDQEEIGVKPSAGAKVVSKPPPARRDFLGQVKVKSSRFWKRLTSGFEGRKIKQGIQGFLGFLKDTGKKIKQAFSRIFLDLKMKAGNKREVSQAQTLSDQAEEEAYWEEPEDDQV